MRTDKPGWKFAIFTLTTLSAVGVGAKLRRMVRENFIRHSLQRCQYVPSYSNDIVILFMEEFKDRIE